MLSEINKKLNYMNEKILSRSIYVRKIKDTYKEIEIKETELSKFKKQLEKEKKDVEKLNKLTLTNLIATLTGSKDDKLSKEEYEYLNAKIRNDKLVIELDELNRINNNYKQELNNIDSLKNEYKNLIKQKKEIIIRSANNETLKIINDLTLKSNKITQDIIEVKEAIQAGEDCTKTLKNTLSTLHSAQNWGRADIFMNKSMLVSMVKHNKLDEANKEINLAKIHIDKFNRELKDVNVYLENANMEISGIAKTFDIFFDNIFTDLSIQNKISNSLDNINRASFRVNGVLKELYTIKQSREKRLKEIEIKINNIIVKYN
ncbi:hypothetical protein RJG79_07530 [Mycoplasmatota bacterium WC44]